MLSELYLLSAVLKRFEDEGRMATDETLVDYCMAAGLKTMETAVDEVIANFPVRPAAWLMRAIVRPEARRRMGPSDGLAARAAALITKPSEARERLTAGLFLDAGRGAVLVERAFQMVEETEPLRARLHKAKLRDRQAAQAKGLLSAAEAAALQAAEDAVHRAVMVDDFAPAELKPGRGIREEAEPAQPMRDNRQAVGSL
jgi:acyl-CoA dehydrogenase